MLRTSRSPTVPYVDCELYRRIGASEGRELSDSFTIPIRSGRAWEIPAGHVCRIVTIEGPQVGLLVTVAGCTALSVMFHPSSSSKPTTRPSAESRTGTAKNLGRFSRTRTDLAQGPGDYFEFFAEIDVLAALYTCPEGDLSVPMFGPGAGDTESVCRPLGIDVYRVPDEALVGWRTPQTAAYA